MGAEAGSDDLATRFATSARTSLPRAPLHAALSAAIAERPRLVEILEEAPPRQHQPVLLLAALHFLLLGEPSHPLARWYPTIAEAPRPPTDPDLGSTLVDFVDDHEEQLRAIVAGRSVQTNEIGRCSLLLPPFGAIADETARPLAHLDVGSSAGLTLLLPHLGFDYDVDGGERHVGDGDIRLRCGVRGRLATPIPSVIPAMGSSVGVDPHPVNPSDADSARWLLACCWPDELDRFDRLRAALALAASRPPTVVAGSAERVTSLVEAVDWSQHPVVTTTWVLTYLTAEERADFVDRLHRLGSARDLDWIFAESPAQTPDLPHPPELAGHHITALVRVSWSAGRRSTTHLARAHPHGHWMHALAT